MGLVPGGAYNNREYLKQRGISFAEEVTEALQDLCFDPQTSGGLLYSLPPEEGAAFLRALQDNGVMAARIGVATQEGRGDIYVDN